jgi:diamine N-acetyltransferase
VNYIEQIKSIDTPNNSDLINVLHKSFRTVADEYGFTLENNPNHGSFITQIDLNQMINNGLKMFGCFENNEIIGCVGIRKSNYGSMFNIEKLGVLPNKRHRGVGSALIKFSINEIQNRGGRIISIAIINKNEELKEWYQNLGFIEYEINEPLHLSFSVCYMRMSI